MLTPSYGIFERDGTVGTIPARWESALGRRVVMHGVNPPTRPWLTP